MRYISFAHTCDQFRSGAKTVTRRLGWERLKVGERLLAVESCRPGKGRRVQPLGCIEVVSVRRESLESITQADVIAEGFPDWTPEHFIGFFVMRFDVHRTAEITRIEFKRVAEVPA